MSVTQASDDTGSEDVLISLMKDAIELMELDEKRSYLEAVRRCPDIVKTESDFINFLRFEEFDIWKAVRRLLKYWDNRIGIYGERAFRSLFDLTGNGVLDEYDLKVLATKAHVLLPNDSNGHGVGLYDQSKRGKEFSNLDAKRIDRQSFFLFEFTAFQQRHEGNMVPEACMLILRSDMPRWLVSRNSRDWASFLAGVTCKCKATRYLLLPKEKSKKAWVQAAFPTFVKEVLKRTSNGIFGNVRFFCDDSENGMKLQLLALGLTEEGLPPSLGGTWEYDSFSFFTRLPVILENTNCRAILPTVQKQPGISAGSEFQATDASILHHPSVIPAQNMMNGFLYSAEIDRIPYHERLSWIKAQRYPDLVQQESLLSQFHWFHNGMTAKAAEQLLSYWSLREKLFFDRALLNMNQIGTGALDWYDRQNLNSGFLMLLPMDSDGSHTLFYDPSRLQKYVASPQKRILFYMLFLAVEKSYSKNAKIKFLIYLNKTESSRKKLVFSDVIDAFPVDVVSYHLVIDQEALADESYQKQARAKVLSLFNCSANRVVVHTLVSKLGCDFLCDELAVYGFTSEHIPDSLGGMWNDECLLMWHDERIKCEASRGCQNSSKAEEHWEAMRRKLAQNAKRSGGGNQHGNISACQKRSIRDEQAGSRHKERK